MPLLSIVNCLDPILRKKCRPVENINDKLIKLSEDMIETMYESGGLGLAANQVGLSSGLFVINISIQKEERNPIVIINPTITASEDKEMGEEGCLSIPDIFTEVERAQRVEVKGYDLKGDEVRYEAEGFLARAFQHEMDHLNGILFWDNLGKVKRDILKRKFRKKLKELEE
jgi:peptide deformylase|tara:strand:+ start:137 stop:649 length:513 start_codon:yes stop_codon:yes gene_type:complete